MAYDEHNAERIRQYLGTRRVAFRELRMMGGWCVLVDDKMCVAMLSDKASSEPILMARVGPQVAEQALQLDHVTDQTASVRPVRGYVFVGSSGFNADVDLMRWIDAALLFNPQAKASKSTRRK